MAGRDPRQFSVRPGCANDGAAGSHAIGANQHAEKILAAAGIILAANGAAVAQTLNEGEVLGNFSPTPGPAVPTDLTGTAGFGLFGNGVGTAPSYQGYLGYSATTPRSWQGKAGDFFNVMDYAADNGCVPDSVAVCTAAFNAAFGRCIITAVRRRNAVTTGIAPPWKACRVHTPGLRSVPHPATSAL